MSIIPFGLGVQPSDGIFGPEHNPSEASVEEVRIHHPDCITFVNVLL